MDADVEFVKTYVDVERIMPVVPTVFTGSIVSNLARVSVPTGRVWESVVT
jgi:hypothetical protein